MNANELHPNKNLKNICYIKNVVQNPNIQIGDFTYYNCEKGVENFEVTKISSEKRMVILITGASHTGKTTLAQKLLEKIQISLFLHRPPENGAYPKRTGPAHAHRRRKTHRISLAHSARNDKNRYRKRSEFDCGRLLYPLELD